MNAPAVPSGVASPCTSVCTLDRRTGFCLGCARTLDEIAEWRRFTDDERLAVLARLDERRAILAGGAMIAADWYFDFISPFAYLQSERLASLAPAIRVRYRPILFAGLLDAHGQKGPAEIAAKRVFTYRFVVWQAKRLSIPLKFPHEHPFNPLPLLRLAIACDCAPEAVHRIFRFVWRDGRLPDLPIEWAELVHDLGVPDAQARIGAPEVKEALRRNTDEAVARGVFGVPTLAIGDALFWGVDATDMAREYAVNGARFTDPEYERVATLPEGVQRTGVRTPPGKPKTRVVGTAR